MSLLPDLRGALIVLGALAPAVLVPSGLVSAISLVPRAETLPDLSTIINFSAFPQCAAADCIVSQAFSASRLGCESGSITAGCFCDDTLEPLNCVPTGPSDEDPCWSESEDWMLGVCGKANLIDRDTMPDCIVECVITYLIDSGCGPTNGTVSRNCFCKLAQLDAKLDKPNLPKRIEQCKKAKCWKNMSPDFSYEEWKDGICTHGIVEKYDQTAYNKHVKKIKGARIAALVVIPFIAAILGLCTMGSTNNSANGGSVTFAGVTFVVITVVLYAVVLTPLYVVL